MAVGVEEIIEKSAKGTPDPRPSEGSSTAISRPVVSDSKDHGLRGPEPIEGKTWGPGT